MMHTFIVCPPEIVSQHKGLPWIMIREKQHVAVGAALELNCRGEPAGCEENYATFGWGVIDLEHYTQAMYDLGRKTAYEAGKVEGEAQERVAWIQAAAVALKVPPEMIRLPHDLAPHIERMRRWVKEAQSKAGSSYALKDSLHRRIIAEENERRLEDAYWRFDTKRAGRLTKNAKDGETLPSMAERDAFKAVLRTALTEAGADFGVPVSDDQKSQPLPVEIKVTAGQSYTLATSPAGSVCAFQSAGDFEFTLPQTFHMEGKGNADGTITWKVRK